MARPLTAADAVRTYAMTNRVFSRADLSNDLGEDAAKAVETLVGRDIDKHAMHVYSLHGIEAGDDRVVAKIAQSGAKPLSDKARATQKARREEHNAKATGARISSAAMTLADRVRLHFQTVPIALRSELRRALGAGAVGAVDALVKAGTIKRIQDGLYARTDVDPLGDEMRRYIEAHSIELANIKREIETAMKSIDVDVANASEISYARFTPMFRQTDGSERPGKLRVYVNVPNLPSVYAESTKAMGVYGLAWKADAKTGLSRLTAEHIAHMVFEAVPETMRELLELIDSGNAPLQRRRRSGGYDQGRGHEVDAGRAEPAQDARPDRDDKHRRDPNARPSDRPQSEHGAAYGPQDTWRLDPAKLTDPLREGVTLEIDDREYDFIVTRLTGVTNLHTIRTRLPVGDYRARHGGRELIFERKDAKDLTASIDSGHFTKQVRDMSELGSPCCVIAEGGFFGSRAQPLPKLAAMQARLIYGMQINVIETIDRSHTAYAIVVAIRNFFFGAGDKFDIAPVRLPQAGPIEIAKVMIQTIPGISPTRAAALIARYGSLAGVARASVKDIADIAGIGKVTAMKLHEVLHAGEMLGS